MNEENTSRDYRINELERKVAGMQRQIGIMTARNDVTTKKHERSIRDLEIKTAVLQGLPQNKVAKIYTLTPGRVSQIAKKIA